MTTNGETPSSNRKKPQSQAADQPEWRAASDLKRFDFICDRFERAFRAGQGLRIEDVLSQVSAAEQGVLLAELLGLEIDLRLEEGEFVLAEEYLKRFPGKPEIVCDAFSRVAFFRGSDGPPKHHRLRPTAISEKPRFQIVAPLGQGSLGELFIADDEQLDRKVALKRIKLGDGDNTLRLDRFEREAKITGQLEHPGIAPVYAASVGEDGLPFYAMRLIRGETLSEAITRLHKLDPWGVSGVKQSSEARVSLNKLLNRLISVCGTVAYAHNRGVIHRDLKPENVMLGPDEETLVVDWGFAKRLGDPSDASAIDEQPHDGAPFGASAPAGVSPLTLEGWLIGTLPYMSPEQAAGWNSQVGPSSDIYGLGAILYHVLIGEPPLKAERATEEQFAALVRRIQNGDITPPQKRNKRIPRDLEAVCLKAMSVRSADRYQSARAMAEDLEKWLADAPVSARREPRISRLRRWASRHPAAATATVAAFLASLAMGQRAWHQAESEGLLVDSLLRSLQTASFGEVPAISRQLAEHPGQARSRLRSLRDDGLLSPDQRLHALLAAQPIDPEAARIFWEHLRTDPDFAVTIVDRMIASAQTDPERFAAVRDLLRPARRLLSPALAAKLRSNRNEDRLRNQQIARLLLDYASDDPDTLADAVIEVEENLVPEFLERLRDFPDRSIARLRERLAPKATYWPAAPLDPTWVQPVPSALTAAIEKGRGLLDRDFAMCQTLSRSEFQSIADRLRLSGYRPIRVRPYRDGAELRVAAVWTRDPLNWRIVWDADAQTMRHMDKGFNAQGFEPVDVAAIPMSEPGLNQSQHRYVGVWSELNNPNWSARLKRATTSLELAWLRWPQHSWEETARPEILFDLNASEQLEVEQSENECFFSNLQVTDNIRKGLSFSGLRCRGPERSENPHSFHGDAENLKRRVSQGGTAWDIAIASRDDFMDQNADRPNYAVTWMRYVGLESEILFDLTPEAHLKACRDFAARGLRPAAIGLTASGLPAELTAASVWHRPIFDGRYPDSKHKLSRAALVLMRLGQAGETQTRLQASDEPALRTFIIHGFGPLGNRPEWLISHFQTESNISARRAMLWTLATFERNALEDKARQAFGDRLLALYRTDADPGLHAAINLLLRRWGRSDEIRRVDRELSTQGPEHGRDWYVNGQGQTMTVLRGPIEFWMGESIITRHVEKFNPRHRVAIDRSFAIGTTEVTIEQYRAFDPKPDRDVEAQPFLRRFFPTSDCPAICMNWFDAARYCNWLSAQEGIPSDQWCYAETSDGITLVPNYLSRTGYRLPTEAEWEYACRANSTTSRSFGEAELDADRYLISQYCWEIEKSGNRAHSVAQLMPNDFGLFDMLGNAHEWCQDPFDSSGYRIDALIRSDSEFPGPVRKDQNRVLRGGWFHHPLTGLYSNHRSWGHAGTRNTENGFRVARTLNISENRSRRAEAKE